MDVAGIIQTIAISLPPLLLALTLHELAHGYVALQFGDETARWAGRLTLNPIKHMDPLGTFFILFAMITRTPVIGWAKPVPVNPHNLRRPHIDMIWVALAGPAMNLLLAVASALALKWFPNPSLVDGLSAHQEYWRSRCISCSWPACGSMSGWRFSTCCQFHRWMAHGC